MRGQRGRGAKRQEKYTTGLLCTLLEVERAGPRSHDLALKEEVVHCADILLELFQAQPTLGDQLAAGLKGNAPHPSTHGHTPHTTHHTYTHRCTSGQVGKGSIRRACAIKDAASARRRHGWHTWVACLERQAPPTQLHTGTTATNHWLPICNQTLTAVAYSGGVIVLRGICLRCGSSSDHRLCTESSLAVTRRRCAVHDVWSPRTRPAHLAASRRCAWVRVRRGRLATTGTVRAVVARRHKHLATCGARAPAIMATCGARAPAIMATQSRKPTRSRHNLLSYKDEGSVIIIAMPRPRSDKNSRMCPLDQFQLIAHAIFEFNQFFFKSWCHRRPTVVCLPAQTTHVPTHLCQYH